MRVPARSKFCHPFPRSLHTPTHTHLRQLVEAMSSIHAAESLAGSETFTLKAPSVQVSLIDDRLVRG